MLGRKDLGLAFRQSEYLIFSAACSLLSAAVLIEVPLAHAQLRRLAVSGLLPHDMVRQSRPGASNDVMKK